MDSPERGALMLVRFIAVALIGWSAADFGLDWAGHHYNPKTHPELNLIGIIGDCLPALVGFIGLVKAKALAEWISNILDD
jgi:hypothetical protein